MKLPLILCFVLFLASKLFDKSRLVETSEFGCCPTKLLAVLCLFKAALYTRYAPQMLLEWNLEAEYNKTLYPLGVLLQKTWLLSDHPGCRRF